MREAMVSSLKRKKLNNLDGWGEQGTLKEDEVDIRKWLQDDVFQERDTILLTS